MNFVRAFGFAATLTTIVIGIELPMALAQNSTSASPAQTMEAIDAARRVQDWRSRETTSIFDQFRNTLSATDPAQLDDKAIDGLEDLISRRASPVQSTAAIALGRVGPRARRTVPAMQALLLTVECDRRSDTARALRLALSQLGFPPPPLPKCGDSLGFRWRLPSIIPEAVANAAPAPPLEAENEAAISNDDALAAECQKLEESFPYNDTWAFWPPVFTSSDKWGNVMRVDFAVAYVNPKPTGRMVCWRQDGIAMAIVEYDHPPKWDRLGGTLIMPPRIINLR